MSFQEEEARDEDMCPTIFAHNQSSLGKHGTLDPIDANFICGDCLPFFEKRCNAPLQSSMLPRQTCIPPADPTEILHWELLIEIALSAGLARLFPDSPSFVESKMTELVDEPIAPPNVVDPLWLQRVQERSGPDEEFKEGTHVINTDHLLARCADTPVFQSVSGACVIQYGQNRIGQVVALAAEELGDGAPVLIVVDSATECIMEDDEDVLWGATRVVRLSMDVMDFCFHALLRPVAAGAVRKKHLANSAIDKQIATDKFALHPGETIELRINGLAGPVCSVGADGSMSIGEVKRKISTTVNMPCTQQRLLVGTSEPKDSDLVRTFNSLISVGRTNPMLDVTLVHRSTEQVYWLKTVESRGEALEFAPADIVGDREVVMVAVKENACSLQYAAAELKADRELVMTAVKKTGGVLWCASEELRSDRNLVMNAVREDGHALQHACEALQDDGEVVSAAVRKNGTALKHASKRLRSDRDVVLMAVASDPRSLQFAGRELHADRSIIYAVVRRDPQHGFQRAAPELRSDLEIAVAAVRSNGMALQYVATSLRANYDVVLAAVQNQGLALSFASEELRAQRDVVLAAVKNTGFALQFASADLRADREVVLRALQQDAGALKHAANELRNEREVAIAAIQQNNFALSSVSDNLRLDRDVILASVEKNCRALQCASPALLDDRAFLLQIAAKNALALEFVPMRWRSDRDFMMTVVRRNGFALKYAADHLRADAEVVLAAVQQDRRAMEYANRDALHAQIQRRNSTRSQDSEVFRRCALSGDLASQSTTQKEQEQYVSLRDVRYSDQRTPKQSTSRRRNGDGITNRQAYVDHVWRTIAEFQAGPAWPPSKVIICASHLCGYGMDTALRSMAEGHGRLDDDDGMPRVKTACAMIPCCHHLCEWSMYINQQFFVDTFPDPLAAFRMLTTLAPWADAAQAGNDAGRQRLGRAACSVLNVGRALWLRETLRWQYVDLVRFSDDGSFCECVALLAAC